MRNEVLVLGLGSNIGSSIDFLRRAVAEIRKINSLKVLKISSIYSSDALLPDQAPDHWNKKYLNVNVLVEAESKKADLNNLLLEFQKIEKKLGRVRENKWQPREIDIDILYSSQQSMTDNDINVPHKELFNRPFALLPLIEVLQDSSEQWEIFKSQYQNKFPEWVYPRVEKKPFNTIVDVKLHWPEIMAIANLTEDSFSDGGQFFEKSSFNTVQFQNWVIQQVQSGAEIIDIGAESTRPGARPVEDTTELKILTQALNILSELKANYHFKISLDCRKPQLHYQLAEKFEFDFVNDVEGLKQKEMIQFLKDSKKQSFVMHSLTVPADPEIVFDETEDVLLKISDWMRNHTESLIYQGLNQDQIILDYGIGFGKTKLQNLRILKNLERLRLKTTQKVLVGHSRKSYQSLFSQRPASERDFETGIITSTINTGSVDYIRVHNTELNVLALKAQTLLSSVGGFVEI